jgi:mannose-1-phosphate guanylyltransferase
VLDPLVVCNEAHRFIVAEQLRELGSRATAVVLAPKGRNTAPAIAVAALIAQRAAAQAQNGDDALLLVLPADHLVRDTDAFAAAVAVAAAAEAAAAGHLVTFGIVPDPCGPRPRAPRARP